ncbi:hypothetical protein IV203_025411 [Nitzschia inconspicua]|uniref:Uncharacterized protein n=1 Tax=Nitzschia inconspicua TaxID=303405 RepID=A0A9K3K9H4_9STRA|nr:hypothetical protein IV203_024782 [Nitzschia inconspicua]KAG7362527.1 hypothetical protein IV203_025411 [Nitzschia inconspicua]
MSNPTTEEKDDNSSNMDEDSVEETERTSRDNNKKQGVTDVQTSDEVQQQAIIDFVDHVFEGKNNQTERDAVLLDLKKKINASVTFGGLRNFLEGFTIGRRSLSDEELDGFARAIKDSFDNNDSTGRAVTIEYQITNTKLSHDYDLVSFAKHIETLATEYWNSNETPPYVAPYFCLIQSSGMGKTKLLYEYRNNYSTNDFESKVILVCDIRPDATDERVFDDHFVVTLLEGADASSSDLVTKRKKEAQVIFRRPDTMVDSKLNWKQNTPFRVLLFDEAQLLLKEEFGMKAFQFRCVRLWLRKMREHKYVAVFTGTSSGLTNFEIETDQQIVQQVNSRGLGDEDTMSLRPKGSILFPHFVMLTTIGCQVQVNRSAKSGSNHSEYNNAIIHGRPLFSIMNDRGDLEAKLPNILRRMLLLHGGEKGKVSWDMNINGWFSILATRVQMGITSIAVASDLVAKGYANLTHVSPDFAHFTYLPDPVCARLAMGMMTVGWNLGDMKGKSPSDWVGKLSQIYSSGLCQPEKGDFGEVLAALYFLLCGDILRHEHDNDLKTFSVDLDVCFALLMNGGNTDVTKTPAAKRRRMDKEWKNSSKTSVTLSCIQFCRNYLRSYETDWSSLGDQQFLRQLYASGTGFFTYAGCPTIDAVFPLHIREDESEKYIPCLLSIKARKYFSPESANKLCNEMMSKAKMSMLQALCVVVVFGSGVQPKKKEPTFNSDTYSLLEDGTTVAVVLRIPVGDIFGISRKYQQLTTTSDLMEVYGSHSFIRAHTGNPESVALDPEAALRASSFGSNEALAESLLVKLSEQLRQSPPSQEHPSK